MLHGAWLPVYGVGGILLVVLLKHFQDKPLKVFLVGIGICAATEYITSLSLEIIFHTRWWDYSGEFMNLDGRICLLGLLVFGVVGCLMVCVFVPTINSKIITLPKKSKTAICILLSVVFVVDLTYSLISPNVGYGITM
jgi:uncharacterized membrane protein